MAKKFRLGILRRGGGDRDKRVTALQPLTNLPNGNLPPATKKKKHATGAAAKQQGGGGRKHSLFQKNRGPGGLEVTTGLGPTSSEASDVSAMTPATGLPPDSPHRPRDDDDEPPSLVPPRRRPPPPPRTNENPLYPATMASPPSSPGPSPSRADMSIEFRRGSSGRDGGDDDEVSLLTPLTGVPLTPEAHTAGTSLIQQRLISSHLLGCDDDDESRELTVYEDSSRGSGAGGGGAHDGGPGHAASTRANSWEDAGARAPGAGAGGGPPVKVGHLSRLARGRISWPARTEYFRRAIDASFDMVDADGSGDVTLEELYAGLLLIHLNMAAYVGAPCCRPASKEYVTEVFHLLDADNSGTLSKEEFTMVMKILYSQVFTRIAIQWSLTLMIVPVMSQYIVKYAGFLHQIAHEFWKDVEDDLNPLQKLFWKLGAFFLRFTPGWLRRVGEVVWLALCRIPGGIWRSMPYTVLTLSLTSVALPYALNQVEDFFRRMAQGDAGRREGGQEKLKEM